MSWTNFRWKKYITEHSKSEYVTTEKPPPDDVRRGLFQAVSKKKTTVFYMLTNIFFRDMFRAISFKTVR